MKFHPKELPWTYTETYLKGLCKTVMGKSRLLNAVTKYSGLSKEDVKKHLTWGKSAPLLYFEIPKRSSNGWYKLGGNTIYVSFWIGLDLEYPEAGSAASRKHLKYLMESTVLHEFIHWARDQKSSKKVHVAGKKSQKYEAGKSFECAAYGGDISMLDDALVLSRKDIKGGTSYNKFTCKTKVDERIKAVLKKAGGK